MEQIGNTHLGMTGNNSSQNNGDIRQTIGKTGWRKPTPGLVHADRFAQRGERSSIPKSRAIVAVKKVASAIGLKSQEMLLLDSFAAVSQPQDWEKGRRPIVWTSNKSLMEQTGFSLTTLRRHVRKLCEAGVISIAESPNGKRWGRRDKDGVIIEAYGFDLAPLAARAIEFETFYADLRVKRQVCTALSNMIKVTRRMVRAKIEMALESDLRGPWSTLKDEYATLVQGLPKGKTVSDNLEKILDWFKALKARVDEAFLIALAQPESDVQPDPQSAETDADTGQIPSNMTPMDPANGTQIPTAAESQGINRNGNEKGQAADGRPGSQTGEPAKRAEKVNMDIEWSTQRKPTSDIDIPTLMTACPTFAQMAHGLLGYLRNWNDVHRAAEKIRPMVGISDDAWHVANRVLGPEMAAGAIALICDKFEAGLVRSPGGYLRGIVEKARAGELHLDRSFYGRLSEAVK